MTTRRELLTGLTATAVAGALPVPAEIVNGDLFSAVGITAKIERAAALAEAGADFIVESVADFLMPLATESVFSASLARARASALPIRGCNSFLRDPSLVCIGPKADHARVLSYAEIAFARLKRVGGEFIVFGSSNARQLPANWSRQRADEQFIGLLRALGDLARKHEVLIGVESLRRQECNYLNHIDEVVAVVSQANSPLVCVLADLFHMRVMGDTPAQLAAARPWVKLVEVAEKEKRTVPGVVGDDFRPYFLELARGGFQGLVDIEADGSASELRNAFSNVRAQAADAQRLARESE